MQAIAHLPGCSSNSSSIRLLRESCGERRLHVVPCCSCVVTRACKQEVCLAKDDSKRRGRGRGGAVGGGVGGAGRFRRTKSPLWMKRHLIPCLRHFNHCKLCPSSTGSQAWCCEAWLQASNASSKPPVTLPTNCKLTRCSA